MECGGRFGADLEDQLGVGLGFEWRAAGEQRLIDSGLKASIVQPGIVYGYGKGIPAMFAGSVTAGTVPLFGTGEQHWTTVHVDDLAELYVRVLEQAPGARAYIGASGDNPTVRELGEALGGAVAPESTDATVERLGAFGEALLLDQKANGARAKSELGWQPTRPSLLDELRTGYLEVAA